MIPELLVDDQKTRRVEIARDNSEMINNDEDLLKKVITGDSYDPETKHQSLRWRLASSQRPKKACHSWSNAT